jgi:xeroderma pigmentosum group C-complementing protein
LFDSALKDLISWWWQSFQVNNSFEGMISRSWSDAEVLYQNSDDANGKGKAKGNHPEDQFLQLLESGEPIHGVKSLMKRALLMKGSRDMSAQLFTSCLRALDIPARLVFSLQPVTWRGAGAGGKCANPSATTQGDTVSGGSKSANKVDSGVNPTKPKSRTPQNAKSKSKRGEWATKAEKAAKAIKAKSVRIDNRNQSLRGTDEGEDEEGDLNSQAETVPVASSSRHSPVIKLRKSRPPTKSRNWAKSPSPEPQEMNRTPVFWTEVYSRPMKEWYCVDVTRKKMRCKNIMEPSRNNPENKMIYVIAYEEGT